MATLDAVYRRGLQSTDAGFNIEPKMLRMFMMVMMVMLMMLMVVVMVMMIRYCFCWSQCRLLSIKCRLSVDYVLTICRLWCGGGAGGVGE
jgi:hypothetical protein